MTDFKLNGDMFYKLFPNKKSYYSARNFCTEQKSSLPILESKERNEELTKMMYDAGKMQDWNKSIKEYAVAY